MEVALEASKHGSQTTGSPVVKRRSWNLTDENRFSRLRADSSFLESDFPRLVLARHRQG